MTVKTDISDSTSMTSCTAPEGSLDILNGVARSAGGR